MCVCVCERERERERERESMVKQEKYACNFKVKAYNKPYS